jgi:hypothetical protein
MGGADVAERCRGACQEILAKRQGPDLGDGNDLAGAFQDRTLCLLRIPFVCGLKRIHGLQQAHLRIAFVVIRRMLGRLSHPEIGEGAKHGTGRAALVVLAVVFASVFAIAFAIAAQDTPPFNVPTPKHLLAFARLYFIAQLN